MITMAMIWTFFLLGIAESLAFEPLNRISAILGREALLPCETQTSDFMRLILWHRHGNSTPFYSVDYRNNSNINPIIFSTTLFQHHNTSIISRFIHDFRGIVPFLRIKNVTESDAGIYRCRVEYSSSPTFQNDVRLHVIGPPTTVELYDSNSQVIHDEILGPFNEHENLTLACVAYGGDPKPQVNWYRRNGYSEELIDSSHEYRPLTAPKHGALSSVVNILSRKLTRTDYRALFLCRSTTSGYRPILERSLRVDLNLAPTSVRIFSLSPYHVHGTSFTMNNKELTTIGCRSDGSHPPATLEWLLDNISQSVTNSKFVSIITTTALNGTTLSVIRFMPDPSDNGRILSCRARNSLIAYSSNNSNSLQYQNYSSSTLVDSITLNVFYKPKLEIVGGKYLSEKNFSQILVEESEFGYFDLHCNIEANPWIHNVTWSLNGIDIVTFPSSLTLSKQLPFKAGNVKSSNAHRSSMNISSLDSNGTVHFRTLNGNRTLRLFSPHNSSHTGFYRCRATNAIGEASSFPTKVQIGYKPKCVGQNRFIEVTHNKLTKLNCEIDAIPNSKIKFYWTALLPWKMSNSAGILNNNQFQNIKNSKFSQDIVSFNTTEKIFTLDVEELFDLFNVQTKLSKPFLVECSATNPIGRQEEPCTFVVNIRDGPPRMLKNCAMNVVTQVNSSATQKSVVHCSKPLNDSCTKVESFHLVGFNIPSETFYLLFSTQTTKETSNKNIFTQIDDRTNFHSLQNRSIQLTQLIARNNQSTRLLFDGQIQFSLTNLFEPFFILPQINDTTPNHTVENSNNENHNKNLFKILLLWSENVNGPSRPTILYRKLNVNSNITKIASSNINTSEKENVHRNGSISSRGRSGDRGTKSAIVVLLLLVLILAAGSAIRRSFYRTESTECNFESSFTRNHSNNAANINKDSLSTNNSNQHDALLENAVNETDDKQENTEPENRTQKSKEYEEKKEFQSEKKENEVEKDKTTESEVFLESFFSDFQTSGGCRELDFHPIDAESMPEAKSDISKLSQNNQPSTVTNSKMTFRQYCNRLLHNSHYKSYRLTNEQDQQDFENDTKQNYRSRSTEQNRIFEYFYRVIQYFVQNSNKNHSTKSFDPEDNRVKLLNMFESDFA